MTWHGGTHVWNTHTMQQVRGRQPFGHHTPQHKVRVLTGLKAADGWDLRCCLLGFSVITKLAPEVPGVTPRGVFWSHDQLEPLDNILPSIHQSYLYFAKTQNIRLFYWYEIHMEINAVFNHYKKQTRKHGRGEVFAFYCLFVFCVFCCFVFFWNGDTKLHFSIYRLSCGDLVVQW